MTRITDLNQHATMISYLIRSADEQAKTEEMIASGKKVNSFADIPGDTGVLMSAKRVEANLEQYTRTSNEIANRLGLQDIQMREMEGVNDDFRQLVTQTIATGSSLNFHDELEGIFQRFVSLLNSSIDGQYIYSGTRTDIPPVNISTLDELAALGAVGDAFDNNQLKRSINIDDNEKVEFGFLASDMAADMFQKIKDIKAYHDGAGGPLQGPLSETQSAYLRSTVQGLIDAGSAMTGFTASNGRVARQVENALARHEESDTFVKTFIGNIEDADLADAVSRLTMNQLQSQATAKVIAQLSRISLLDYI